VDKCPRCNRRKLGARKVKRLDGTTKTVKDVFCKVCAKEIDKAVRMEGREEKADAIKSKVLKSGIPYTDTDGRVNDVLALTEGLDGGGVFIHGVTGTFKTRTLCVLAHRAIKKDMSLEWESCPVMLSNYSQSLMDNTAGSMLDRLIRPAILVIDDWGKGKVTDRGREFLYNVVNLRFERGRSIWYTSNKRPEWVKNGWIKNDESDDGPAIERRIVQSCRVIDTGEIT
jgi:DNA replication protein DnaC